MKIKTFFSETTGQFLTKFYSYGNENLYKKDAGHLTKTADGIWYKPVQHFLP